MLEGLHNSGLDMDAMFDEQPQETEHEPPFNPTGTQSSTGESSAGLPKGLNTGFACSSCAAGDDDPGGKDSGGDGMCSLVALACILALFTFDKDKPTGYETVSPYQYLAGKNLQQALETATEAMKGRCRQSVSELLEAPLFSNSLALSDHIFATKASLEGAVSSVFRSPLDGSADTRHPVAVLIANSGAHTTNPYNNAIIAIGVRLRGHLGPFVLVTYGTGEGAANKELCTYLFDSPADFSTRLNDQVGDADVLYTLTPRDSVGTIATRVENPGQLPDNTKHTHERHIDDIGEQGSAILESDLHPMDFASGRPASPENALSTHTHLEQDSKDAWQTDTSLQAGQVSLPPPYQPEDSVAYGESPPYVAPHSPFPTPSNLCEESSKPPAPQEVSSESQHNSSSSLSEATSRRKSTHSDFGWMHALQSAGPIVHPLPQRASPKAESVPRSIMKKTRMSPPNAPPESKLPPPPLDLLPQPTQPSGVASGSTASSSKAPRRRPSKSSSPKASAPQFFDTNQLDLLFSVPRVSSRGNLRAPQVDSQSNRSEVARAGSSTRAPEASHLEVRSHEDSLPPVEEMDALSIGESPHGDVKQKEGTGPSQPRDFEWQIALMGASRTSPYPNSESKSPVARGKAKQPHRSTRPEEPWSPAMLRPELANPEVSFDDSDAGSVSSAYRDYGPPKVKTFKASRNDIAWQLALVSTVLKPSDGYMKEREKRFIELNPRYRPEHFDCLICFETIAGADGSRMMNCEHSFCRDCMTGHVRSQLEENLYPIICPVCFPDPERTTRGFVDEFVLEELELTPKEVDKFQDLQLATIIVKIDCPGCKQVLTVAREDYLNEPFITCSLPDCGSRFCRACLVVMKGHSDEHACKVDEELDALMKANGWRYCPGCRTPILKESGCNHMTCRTPGCSTHFCYVCGDSIWNATSPESLGTLLTEHFRKCNQFDPEPLIRRGPRRRRGECTIQ